MFCRKCGRPLQDGAVFCPYCGSRYAQADSAGNPGGGYDGGSRGAQMNGPENYAGQPGGQQYYQQGQPGQPWGRQYYQQGQPGSQQYYQQGQPGGGAYNSNPAGPYTNGSGYGPGYGGGQMNQGFYQPGGAQMFGNGAQTAAGGLQMAASGAGMAGQMARGAGKAAKTALWLKLLPLIAAALVAIAVMLYMMFFKVGKPEDTIQKMEDALNKLDQKALLECFDDQTQGLYSGMLGVGGDLIGFDLGAFSDLASGLGGYMSAAGLTPQFDLTVVDVEYTGDDTCIVTVDFAFTYQGESDTSTEVLPMVKDGREWVVSAAGLQ